MICECSLLGERGAGQSSEEGRKRDGSHRNRKIISHKKRGWFEMISSSKKAHQTGQSGKVGSDFSAVRSTGQRRQHSQLLRHHSIFKSGVDSINRYKAADLAGYPNEI